jgi:hypothetical protein
VRVEFLQAIRARINRFLNARIQAEDTYRGHIVKSIDGSSVQLDDTAANQHSYPQPSSQKPGCGFPVMAVMGVLNHAHGGWEDYAIGKERTHDAVLAHQLLDCFEEGDIACADRAFCTYEIIALLQARGAHCVMRLHQARHRVLDLRQGKKLGKNQRLVSWTKPAKQSPRSILTPAAWEALPASLDIRLIWFHFKDRQGKKRRMVLTTTLLDADQYPWEELGALYSGRWDIELRLRDVKTTLQMEAFRVKTPAMAHKTMEMALIAYNLIKATCQEAAQREGEDLRLMSFKGALDTVIAFSGRYLGRQKHVQAVKRIWQSMIETIAQKTIDLRLGRKEPRAIKRRPKSYSYLTAPRHLFQEIPHRGKHRSFA